MKNVAFYFVFIISLSALFFSCDDDDKETIDNVSYLNGVYSNYESDKNISLGVNYNGKPAVGKEVVLKTIDNERCNITFVNVLSTPDIVFHDIKLERKGKLYTIKGDSIINKRKIEFSGDIEVTYSDVDPRASAFMSLNVSDY